MWDLCTRSNTSSSSGARQGENSPKGEAILLTFTLTVLAKWMAPMVQPLIVEWGSHPTQLLSLSTALPKTPPLWDSPLWPKDSQCEKGVPRGQEWGTNLIPIQEKSEEQPELLGMAEDHSFPSAQICFQCCAAAAAAKSLQSCPTLCSPPGSSVPAILQARTLEWVAISFSNSWKWKVKVKSLSRVQLFATPWTTAYQAPPSMRFSRQEYWSGLPLPSPPVL